MFPAYFLTHSLSTNYAGHNSAQKSSCRHTCVEHAPFSVSVPAYGKGKENGIRQLRSAEDYWGQERPGSSEVAEEHGCFDSWQTSGLRHESGDKKPGCPRGHVNGGSSYEDFIYLYQVVSVCTRSSVGFPGAYFRYHPHRPALTSSWWTFVPGRCLPNATHHRRIPLLSSLNISYNHKLANLSVTKSATIHIHVG